MGNSTDESADGRRVYLETFGCQMNVLDSQLVSGALKGLGYRFVDDWREAEVVLYNTCSVREHAEQKVYSRLGEVSRAKEKGNGGPVLGVIGCMAEREGTAMMSRFPQLDLLCGPGELDKVPMLIDNAARTRERPAALQGGTQRRSATLQAAEDELEQLDLARAFSPDAQQGSAYVRITRGCNKHCTYCVVPQTRGREVHRAPDSIVAECRSLVEAGAREITLLGQTVNHYHYDHGRAVTRDGAKQPQVGAVVGPQGPKVEASERVTSFADLLRRIHEEVPELPRLRFITSFPRDFGDDILATMRDCPRICRYLHLPVQSGSNRMLKRMNRGYTVEEYKDLIERVRRYIPDCEIATDVICGFPGETEADHEATADLLRFGRFKNAFIFKYSPRPGTAAKKKLDDDVPDDVKKRRNNELLALQGEIGARVHERYVGTTQRVFVESVSAKAKKNKNAVDPAVTLGWESDEEVTELAGRTDGDLIVIFEGPSDLVGSIVDVEIERAAPLTLFGRWVSLGSETHSVASVGTEATTH